MSTLELKRKFVAAMMENTKKRKTSIRIPLTISWLKEWCLKNDKHNDITKSMWLNFNSTGNLIIIFYVNRLFFR